MDCFYMHNYMLIGFSFEIYQALTSALDKEPTVFLSDSAKDCRKIKDNFNKEPLIPYFNIQTSQNFKLFNITAGSKEFLDLFEQLLPQQETFKHCTIQYKHSLNKKLTATVTTSSPEEIENKFYLACLNAYNTIIDHKLSYLIFSDIPHEGCIYAYYAVAKAMNIPTIICRQSISADYFYITEDISSNLNPSITGNNKTYRINFSKGPIEPKYMYNKKTFCKFPLKELLEVIVKSLCIFPILKSNSRHRLKLAYSKYSYQRHYQNNISKSIDLSKKKYIYFPLHYQPEMTTNVLGGKYVNQAKAIHELRVLLPKEYTIVVKENPIQDWYMREKSFFKIIGSLPGVTYASLQTSTYELTKNAAAVATVAGTAGFEALHYKKPVIYFGAPWYKFLPGTFDFNSIEDIQKVLTFNFSLTKLQAAIDQFTTKLYSGFIPQHHAKHWQKYNLDTNTNADDIAASIKKYIAERT
jgi:hypothetical protein